jgi:hypothetical protein
MTYAKYLDGNGGWGNLFGSAPLNSVATGPNDKTLTKYYQFDLSSTSDPVSQNPVRP